MGYAEPTCSKVAENRVYKFVDFVKSAFQDRGLERDQPENDAPGGKPDDGLVFHGFIATIPSGSGPHDVSPFEDGAPQGIALEQLDLCRWRIY